MGSATVAVSCAKSVPAFPGCPWKGRRVDGRRAGAPCPRCGGPVTVARRPRPDAGVRAVFYKSKSPFSDREPTRAVICGEWAKDMLSIETAYGMDLVVLSEELTLVDPPEAEGGPSDGR